MMNGYYLAIMVILVVYSVVSAFRYHKARRRGDHWHRRCMELHDECDAYAKEVAAYRNGLIGETHETE